MKTENPCICFFPALPLTKNLDLGEWIVGTPPDDTPWRSERFKELVQLLLASFDRQEFRTMALLWHSKRGFDGTRLSPEAFTAAQAAVRFAVLDANDRLPKDDPNTGHSLATSENASLYMQPLDEERGYIAHLEGGALRHVVSGGWKIGEKPMPLPDAVVAIKLSSVPGSSKLAKAVFDAQMSAAPGVSRHIQIAVEWHAVALANPRAVTWQQRLIALKTGFEALIGTSDSRECARKLRSLFETSTTAHRGLLPWAGILWSPRERTDLLRHYTTRSGKAKTEIRSELEDWFMTLAEARNSIIHDGVISVFDYGPPQERPLSRYSGRLFWIAERVLREAIKASLGPEILLCGRLQWRADWDEAFKKAGWRPTPEAGVREPPSAPSSDEDEAAVPVRELSVLLQQLGCPAANYVELSRAPAPAAASEEVLRTASSRQVTWVAKAGKIEITVNATEKKLLETAGAEDKLPDDFTLCD